MRRLGSTALMLLLGSACATGPDPGPPAVLPAATEPLLESELGQRVARHGFPRLANLLHNCCGGPHMQKLFEQLHLWDLAIVDDETVNSVPEYLGPGGLLRRRNPDLVIVANFSAADINLSPGEGQTLMAEFNSGLDPSWYLRDASGGEVLLYDSTPTEWTRMQNHTTAVSGYLPRHLDERVFRTGLVDGIYYDWIVTNISWLNNVDPPRHGPLDIDNDGIADSAEKIDRLWMQGLTRMLENSRQLYGPDAIIMGNAGWNTGLGYARLINGIMIEQFLRGQDKNRSWFGWSGVMRTYAHYQQHAQRPRLAMIMANSDDPRDYRWMRFALASTLMFDGYFCFTNIAIPRRAYTTVRWYDEYAVDLGTGEAVRSPDFKGYLGPPLSPAYDVKKPSQTLAQALRKGRPDARRRVWRRDFTNGIVLVNPTSRNRRVELRTSYRKIRGIRDPQFNDGSVLRRLELPPESGAVLLRMKENGELGWPDK